MISHAHPRARPRPARVAPSLRPDRLVRRWWVPLLLACSACVDGGGAADARAEIEAITRRWEASLVAGSPEMAVSDVFTPDAARMPSGAPVSRGRAAIAAALEGSTALEEAGFEIRHLEVEGDLAFAEGVYRVRAPDGTELSGKFLEVWRRTPEGWRIHRVMWD